MWCLPGYRLRQAAVVGPGVVGAAPRRGRAAAAQLAALQQAVAGGPIGNALAAIVATAEQQVAAGETGQACLTLGNFIFQVQLVPPRFISAATAA